MFKLGARLNWLEGRKLQEAMAAEAAASATANVFAGTAQGSDVVRAVRKARAVARVEAAPAKAFDIRALHVNFADQRGSGAVAPPQGVHLD